MQKIKLNEINNIRKILQNYEYLLVNRKALAFHSLIRNHHVVRTLAMTEREWVLSTWEYQPCLSTIFPRYFINIKLTLNFFVKLLNSID